PGVGRHPQGDERGPRWRGDGEPGGGADGGRGLPDRSLDHPPPPAGRRLVRPHRPCPRRALPGCAGRGGGKHRPELARAAPPARSVVLGAVGIGSGPRWSLDWGGGSRFGVEFDVTLLQDRLGVSFGFRSLSGGNWNTPFVALTIADLNGTLYWLIPPAWRSGR